MLKNNENSVLFSIGSVIELGRQKERERQAELQRQRDEQERADGRGHGQDHGSPHTSAHPGISSLRRPRRRGG